MSNFIAPETRDLESHQHPAGLARAQIECWVQDGIRWVFAYGSLIWDPIGPWTRRERARLVGYHRRFCIGSRAYRGTPELPGSLLGLMPGGSCVGIGYELAEDGLRQAMDVVVAREMPLGTVPIYLPRRAAVQLDTGERVIALVFVADRTSPHFEPLPDGAAALRVCRSSGRRGTNFDYVLRTEEALQAEAICDRRVSRVMAMARRHPSRTAG